MKENKFAESNYAPHLALFMVQVMFGCSAVIGKIVLQTFPSFAIVGFRVGGAALAFLLIQKFRGNLRLEKTSHYFYFALYSLFGVAFNQMFFFKGLSLTTAANTSLLAVTIPIFAIVISSLIGNDKLNLLKVVGVILASIGVIYLIDPRKASFSSDTTTGNIFIILNCFCYAVYIAISKKLVSHYGALKSLAWIFSMASLITVPIGVYFLQDLNFANVTWTAWAALAAIIIFPTILAYYLNAWALKMVEPSVVAIYTYLQPLVGFMMAVIFLDEHFSLQLLLSSLLIFVGVFLVTRKRRREIISKI